MARLPRLALAGHAHLVSLYGHSGQPVFTDDEDRREFLAALRESALQQRVWVHGYVLLDDHVHLLLTPVAAEGLGRLMQGLGRRYGAGFNRRHGRRGMLWAGRFRATGQAAVASDLAWSSARHHLGLLRDGLITECSAWWLLGNTPFEREAAYRRLLDEGLAAPRAAAIAAAGRKNWALGDLDFLARLAQQAARPVQPRPRGRPRAQPIDLPTGA